MRRLSMFFIIGGILVTLCLGGCGRSPYPDDVAEVLAQAGDNRAELEKVIEHYRTEADSLKLEAAYFLIGNMEGHAYATYVLKDSADSIIPFNAMDYPDYDVLLTSIDSLDKAHPGLDFKRGELINDIDVITADFLITQIDYAFRAWREKPWAENLSFDDFCRYVLPYRGSNEPLENWREYFWDKYADVASGMTDSTDPIEATVLINNDVRSGFVFDRRFYYHPTDLGLKEMLEYGMGRCEDMTNVTIYALRANGLAVTSDYTPCWANAGNNHAWNAILAPDGRVIPFMGAEANPGEYRLRYKLAKVYRKMFNKNPDNPVFLDRKQETIAPWLGGNSFIDATADYVDVCDVEVTFETVVPDSVDLAYLCVFNSGEWKAIHWAKIENNRAVFTDMGRSIAYLPALYLDKEIKPWGAPFILHDDCTRQVLTPGKDRITARLNATTEIERAESTDGVQKAYLTSGKDYELNYWDGEWQALDTLRAGNTPLVFDSVPVGTLYWLTAIDSDREERIFTLDGGEQIWW
ncbi:MAG: transglutaminase domain-containing protein [candidate division Zixibacteria bacterium]|nr:transglutaminase domain-containing protein [candidate division Zixibacteria bacterium]